MDKHASILMRYQSGESVASLAREHGMKWAEVAKACGHVWDRPENIDKHGLQIADDHLQPPPKVIGLD